MTNFKVINNKENRGKGAVVKQGMLEAKGDYRIFMDADNSVSIDVLDTMLPLTSTYQVVIASIGVEGAQKVGHEPFYRRLLGKLGNLFIQLLAVPGIHDTQRGFKLFTAKAAAEVFPRMHVAGWGFDVGALAIARKMGYNIKEVPVSWNNDPSSKVNIWAYPQVLLETIKIRWNLLSGVYDLRV